EFSDLIGLAIVYIYIIIVLLISEKVLKDKGDLSRKFTHIMVGNLLFILPLFTDRFFVTFAVAMPFLILTFLMTKYSPIKLNNKITESGHGLGLFYYGIAIAIMLFLFTGPQMYIVAIGLATMSYGDGFASLVGQRIGKHKYNVFGETKSYEGSLAMFIITSIMIFIALTFYSAMGYELASPNLLVIVTIAGLATVVEGISPKGLDNLSSCFTAISVYLLSTLL
ncbi:MAG: diacylglycerol/polyprenol kinase family protein, partial [Methanobacteriaceae archaeon]